jgi:NAD(P)-dependent dehydrogenase (short-subunit alcohol dehydrogenase family)
MVRVWFVTGASRGLGKAIVQAALDDGDVIAATARNPSQLSSFVEKYGEGRVLPLALDVSKNEEIVKALNSTVEKFGRVDILVNNAGYANVDSIEHVSIDDFRTQFETNFFGTFLASKAAIPIMRKQGSGHIIQISSVGGRVGTPGLASYQSAKWAVGGFSTVLQQEVAPFGIKITVCEPGGIKTDWAGASMGFATLEAGYEQTIGAATKMREGLWSYFSEPAEIAKSINYISKVEDPPLRLLLGRGMPDYGKAASDALASSDEKWLKVTNLEV